MPCLTLNSKSAIFHAALLAIFNPVRVHSKLVHEAVNGSSIPSIELILAVATFNDAYWLVPRATALLSFWFLGVASKEDNDRRPSYWLVLRAPAFRNFEQYLRTFALEAEPQSAAKFQEILLVVLHFLKSGARLKADLRNY